MVAIKRMMFGILVLLFTENMAAAKAKTKFELLTNLMIQSGKGGNQVADGSGDQQLTIVEPTLYIDSQITPHTDIFGSALIDLWSSASEATFDSQTGASGSGSPERKIQNRLDFDLGVAQKVGSFTFTPQVGYSREFDYHSINGGLKVEKGFAKDNFVVALGYHFFFDQTLPFDAVSRSFLSWQNKITHTIEASATQILSPSDLILLGYTFTRQSGFLAGTQNTVNLGGARVSEVMPNGRNRNAINLKYVHGFGDHVAAHFDYRFYIDNWGFRTHTFEPSVYFGFNEEAGLIKVFYRFYMQNASSYYQDSFSTAQPFMTSDSDLQKFTANEGGVMSSYTWDLKNSFLKTISLSGTGMYYGRSNNLHGELLQLGFGGSF